MNYPDWLYLGDIPESIFGIKDNEDLLLRNGVTRGQDGKLYVPNKGVQYGKTSDNRYYAVLPINGISRAFYITPTDNSKKLIDQWTESKYLRKNLDDLEVLTLPNTELNEITVTPENGLILESEIVNEDSNDIPNISLRTPVLRNEEYDWLQRAKRQAALNNLKNTQFDAADLLDMGGAGFLFNPFRFSKNIMEHKYIDAGLQALLAKGIYGQDLGADVSRLLFGGYELAQPEGVRKTWNKFSEGDTAGGILSALGDAINLGFVYSGGKPLFEATNLGKSYAISKALNQDIRNTSLIPDYSSPGSLVSRVTDAKGKIHLRLNTHLKGEPRELVLEPQGDNKYYVHMKTWGGVSNEEKNILSNALYNELPEGAEILFPQSSPEYLGTRGTVAGLLHMSRDPRYAPGESSGTLLYDNGNGQISQFTGTGFVKLPQALEQVPVRGTSLAFYEKPSLTEKLLGAQEVQSYPGYLLKILMKGSSLEKLIAKDGTIKVNNIRMFVNSRGSNVEKEVIDKVLNELFGELTSVEYNLFKKAVLDELIGSYNRVPLTAWADYGVDGLGYNLKTVGENELPGIPNRIILGEPVNYIPSGTKADPISLHTFTFESPRIPYGNTKHYGGNPLGHSRTYVTPEEPDVLHVMESQSDWALQALRRSRRNIDPQSAYEAALLKDIEYLQEIEKIKTNLEKGIAPDGQKIQYEWEQRDIEEMIENIEKLRSRIKARAARFDSILHPEKYILENYLKQNYLQRQLLENLRYAAENGLTKMRYPTPETTAKIEGYLKDTPNLSELEKLYIENFNKLLQDMENTYGRELIWSNPNLKELWESLVSNKEAVERGAENFTYSPKHQTILKKYADFPKLFKKLYKNAEVRTVTDFKGNTWYEVDVPKDYLNQEWLFALELGFKPITLETLQQTRPTNFYATHLQRAKAKGATIHTNREFNIDRPLLMNEAINYLQINYPHIFANMNRLSIQNMLKERGYSTIGHAVFYNPKAVGRNKATMDLFKAHEWEHSAHKPSLAVPKEAIDFKKLPAEGSDTGYWVDNNNTEIGARISQVFDAAGINGNNSPYLTGAKLKKLFEQYINKGLIDNGITKLYKAVKDWDKLAKWAKNPSNVYTTLLILGAGTYAGTNR